MIIVRTARLDRHSAGAVGVEGGSGDTYPPGDDFVLPVPEGPGRRSRDPGARRWPGAAAGSPGSSATSASNARGCPALRGTAGHHDADPFPGRHHPVARQRHRAGGAYHTGARRRETDRRDRTRLRVTLRRSGLQGENPGKKERS